MSDYITRWVHEVKLPLASLKLMNERNQDMELANQMQDCIERIGLHLNTMMMNCKRKNLENDVKIEKLCLEDIVQQSLKNQSWFLIKDHFQIETKLEGIEIYGDRRWLVYILDQLIVNAVKYHGEAPKLLFSSDRRGGQADTVQIILEDNGIGILPEDLPYIFDKGYIGSNLRDGDYRSTGMGLYFVKTICDRLGIKISVQSKAGAWTRFILELKDGEEFYFLTEL